jgi:hypothetical protein
VWDIHILKLHLENIKAIHDRFVKENFYLRHFQVCKKITPNILSRYENETNLLRKNGIKTTKFHTQTNRI